MPAKAKAKAPERDLFDEAGALVASAGRDVPREFVRTLFGRVPEEDLAPYSPQALADLAATAYEHLSAPRRNDGADLRLIDREVERGGGRRDITAIEVVNENMPFLLNSTLAELVEQGYEPRLVAHPILAVERDESGALARLVGEATAAAPVGARRESFIQIHLDRVDDEAARGRLVEGLTKVYADVAVSVRDWPGMRDPHRRGDLLLSRQSAAAAGRRGRGGGRVPGLARRRQFHLPRHARVPPAQGRRRRRSGRGIRPRPAARPRRAGAAARRRARHHDARRSALSSARPKALIITKANVKSRVHRRVHLDYIGVKLFSAEGRLQGELRIVGLFTANAYTSSLNEVPYLRHKVAKVIGARRLRPGEPRRPRAAQRARELSARRAVPDRRGDALPLRDRDHEPVRAAAHPRARARRRVRPLRLGARLRAEGPLRHGGAPAHRRVPRAAPTRAACRRPIRATPRGRSPAPTTSSAATRARRRRSRSEELEAGIAAIVRTWADTLAAALAETIGGLAGAGARGALRRRLLGRLSRSLRGRAVDRRHRRSSSASRTSARGPSTSTAATAIPTRASTSRSSRAAPRCRCPNACRCSRISASRSSTSAPTGSTPPGGEDAGRIWLHDMALERAAGGALDIGAIEGPIEATLLALFRGLAESDGFNKLVLEAGLGWRDVAMVRAFGRYLRQIRLAFGQDYLAATLARHGAIARKIVELFYAALRSARRRAERARGGKRAVRAEIEGALQAVDEPGRGPHPAPLRQPRRSGGAHQLLPDRRERPAAPDASPSSSTAAGSTACRCRSPLYEIFVYSPRVEGVHLRFGKVARGGIRWSDRPQDFRTEVLGLVKAQQVKNAVIVPVGAKGGFFPKQLPPARDREAWLAEGTESYRIFIRTLLDLTDNIDGDKIVPPPDIVRHDGDDPYLVVAADKGTATFSDIANAISIETGLLARRRLRLRRRPGYDHKKMGITARGAWEAVKRHFREMDIDIQTQPFTVVGRRRHVGRRVRQRHAAVASHQARRRLRPPRHLHRSRSRPGRVLRRAQAPVRSAALELAGLRQGARSPRAAASSRAPRSRSRCRAEAQAAARPRRRPRPRPPR